MAESLVQRELVEGFDMISLNAGKKAVSVFAAVVLSFSMVPTYAWGSTSEGETSDADIHSASNGISNNQTVPFSSDGGVDDVLADAGQEGRPVPDSPDGSHNSEGTQGQNGEGLNSAEEESSGENGAASGNSDPSEEATTPGGSDPEADAGTGEGEGADPGAENPEDGDGKEPESDQGLPEVVCPLPAGRYVVLSALAGDAALDIDGASAVDAANAQLWTYNQSGAQMFDVSVNEKGWCTIACAASGKVLDVAWGQDVAGANVHQYEKNDSNAQLWKIEQAADGSCKITSALGEDLVLDVAGASSAAGTNVQVWTSNDTTAQRFYFIDVNPSPISNVDVAPGVYMLKSALPSGKYLDIRCAEKTDGAPAQTWVGNKTHAQMFSIARLGNGLYTLKAVHSGKALDADLGWLLPGHEVHQWDAYASENQQWAICSNEDGTVTLLNAANGLALDVEGANDGDGARVLTYTPNGTAAQKWSLEKVDALLSEGVYSIRSNVSGASIDVDGGLSSSGANVQVWQWNGTPAQRFLLERVEESAEEIYTIEALCSGMLLSQVGDNVQQLQASDDVSASQRWKVLTSPCGGVIFQNVQTGKVLDVAGAGDWDGCNVGVWESNDTVAQSFSLQAVEVMGEGTYSIQCAHDGRMLDVASGSRSDGANVQFWTSNDTGAQKWNVRSAGDGWYVIENARSKKALDVYNYGTTPETNVQQWASGEGNAAQLWRFEYMGGGCFTLVSACGSQVLSVGGGWYDGSNAVVSPATGAAEQLFRMVPATYVPENFTDKIASFSTISTNTANGTFNMMKALNEFDGVVLWPGETMSFFGIAGPCGWAQGYLPAGVVGGIGYGGGICQASTTLYGASIRAGLTIVERRNHSVPSTYVPIGLDAMVDYGSSDFRVRNDWDFPVKFDVTTYGSTLLVDVYGIQPEWYDYIDADSWWTGSRSAAAQRLYYKNGQVVASGMLPASYYW